MFMTTEGPLWVDTVEKVGPLAGATRLFDHAVTRLRGFQALRRVLERSGTGSGGPSCAGFGR